MDDLTIREASENDIPIILDLLYHLGRPKPEKDSDVDIFRNLTKSYFVNSDKQILVAVIENTKIVGVVSMIFLPRLNRITSELYIPDLVVLEEFQNRGIGRQLISSCIKVGKEKNCHRIRLESGNQRKNALHFYLNLGFEQSSLSFTFNIY